MAELAAFFGLAGRDPFLFYTLVAALFLAAVSLGSGWRRGDFIAVLQPRGLLAVVLAVLLGFGLLWLRQTLLSDAPGWLSLRGLGRLPLYVVALAYGPSAGLLAGALFAAFATSSSLPNLPEAVLTLELVVLGWFALAPSPRQHRWAGPLNVLLAYGLAWATGGAAMLQYLTANGASWATQASYHQPLVGGLLLNTLLLFALGPGFYRRVFPGSRIAPPHLALRPEAPEVASEAGTGLPAPDLPRERAPDEPSPPA